MTLSDRSAVKGPFNAQMLSLARKYRGYSQSELSERTELSQAQLSRLEHGLGAPSEVALQKIGEALDFPLAFFQAEGNLFPPFTPLHRKRASLGKKAQERAEALANLRRIHILRLETNVEIDESIPRLDLEEFDGSPRNVARAIRTSLRLPRGPVENMVTLLENSGVFVFLDDLGSRYLDGFTLVGDGLRALVFINRTFPGDRERLNLAHELGHIVMHSIPTGNEEAEAWEFAEEFLLPEASIVDDLKLAKSIADYAALKRKWKVSMAALIRRARTLNMIDQYRYRYLMQLMAPYRVREPVSTPVETPSLVDELLETYRRDLGYTEEDLLSVLSVSKETFQQLYGHEDKRLHIVK